MPAFDPQTVVDTARAMRDVEAMPDCPTTRDAYWSAVGQRLGFSKHTAEGRAKRYGLRPGRSFAKPAIGASEKQKNWAFAPEKPW